MSSQLATRLAATLLAATLAAGCAARPVAAPAATPAPTATPTTRPTAAPTAVPTVPPPTSLPTATVAPSPTAAALTPAPALTGALVTSTLHLDIYRSDGGMNPEALLALAPQFEQAVDAVGRRIGGRLTGRVAVSFEPPQSGPCALRGLTLSHQRTIRLFYGADSDPRNVLAIVVHELAHQHQHDYYGWEFHQRSDVILLEGQATWASADYALLADGRPAWAARAEQALAEGTLLPLNTNLEADCRTATRGSAYTGWASFVAYLQAIYGRSKFDALYRSGQGRAPGSSDYAGVYGKGIDTLDQEWRAWLEQHGHADLLPE